jgi:hypothetical protein
LERIRMKRSAELSECGRFRFSLSREWSAMPRCAWLMLNPSTADADTDDATIREIVKRADAWGYGAVDVVNVIPFRATEPADMWRWHASLDVSDRVDVITSNTSHIAAVAAEAAMRLVGFGADAAVRAPTMVRHALDYFRDGAFCLGTNSKGWPLHPLASGKLRIPANTAPRFWTWPEQPR